MIAQGIKYQSFWGIFLAIMAVIGSVVVIYLYKKLMQSGKMPEMIDADQ